MKVYLVNNITKVTNKPTLNEAIADTRTTGHFILPGAPMDDVRQLVADLARAVNAAHAAYVLYYAK